MRIDLRGRSFRHAQGLRWQSEVALFGELEDAVRVSGHDQEAVVFADAQAGGRIPCQRGCDVAVRDSAAVVDSGHPVQDVRLPGRS